jgi:hypothetical protein
MNTPVATVLLTDEARQGVTGHNGIQFLCREADAETSLD